MGKCYKTPISGKARSQGAPKALRVPTLIPNIGIGKIFRQLEREWHFTQISKLQEVMFYSFCFSRKFVGWSDKLARYRQELPILEFVGNDIEKTVSPMQLMEIVDTVIPHFKVPCFYNCQALCSMRISRFTPLNF